MTHLASEFVHDVFVSYAHGDADDAGSSPLRTWTKAFARELEIELRTIPGLQRTVVFFDDSDRPGQLSALRRRSEYADGNYR